MSERDDQQGDHENHIIFLAVLLLAIIPPSWHCQGWISRKRQQESRSNSGLKCGTIEREGESKVEGTAGGAQGQGGRKKG